MVTVLHGNAEFGIPFNDTHMAHGIVGDNVTVQQVSKRPFILRARNPFKLDKEPTVSATGNPSTVRIRNVHMKATTSVREWFGMVVADSVVGVGDARIPDITEPLFTADDQVGFENKLQTWDEVREYNQGSMKRVPDFCSEVSLQENIRWVLAPALALCAHQFGLLLRRELAIASTSGSGTGATSHIRSDWAFLQQCCSSLYASVVPFEVKSLFNAKVGQVQRGITEPWLSLNPRDAKCQDLVDLLNTYPPVIPSNEYKPKDSPFASVDQLLMQMALTCARFGLLWYGMQLLVFSLSWCLETKKVLVKCLVIDQQSWGPTAMDVVRAVMHMSTAAEMCAS